MLIVGQGYMLAPKIVFAINEYDAIECFVCLYDHFPIVCIKIPKEYLNLSEQKIFKIYDYDLGILYEKFERKLLSFQR